MTFRAAHGGPVSRSAAPVPASSLDVAAPLWRPACDGAAASPLHTREPALPLVSLPTFFAVLVAFGVSAYLNNVMAKTAWTIADRHGLNMHVLPLPDIVHSIDKPLFDFFHHHVLWLPDALIIINIIITALMTLTYTHRARIGVLFLTAWGTLFMLRATLLASTVLPSPIPPCRVPGLPDIPELRPDINVFKVGGSMFCNDLIFSGHTTLNALCALFWLLSSKHWALKALITAESLANISVTLFTHDHYTVDVLLSLYLTTLVVLLLRPRVLAAFAAPVLVTPAPGATASAATSAAVDPATGEVVLTVTSSSLVVLPSALEPTEFLPLLPLQGPRSTSRTPTHSHTSVSTASGDHGDTDHGDGARGGHNDSGDSATPPASITLASSSSTVGRAFAALERGSFRLGCVLAAAGQRCLQAVPRPLRPLLLPLLAPALAPVRVSVRTATTVSRMPAPASLAAAATAAAAATGLAIPSREMRVSTSAVTQTYIVSGQWLGALLAGTVTLAADAAGVTAPVPMSPMAALAAETPRAPCGEELVQRQWLMQQQSDATLAGPAGTGYSAGSDSDAEVNADGSATASVNVGLGVNGDAEAGVESLRAGTRTRTRTRVSARTASAARRRT